MHKKAEKYFVLLFATFVVTGHLYGQQHDDVLSFVNPFIGTAKSNSFTKWGSEGGTYPGAVAPSGYIQLTPETSPAATKGYDYADSLMYNFSCLHHSSGFPNGSAGRLLIMPVDGNAYRQSNSYCRPFLHANEIAIPGYYRVRFNDNTVVEATASERTGVFRFTFPPAVLPEIMIRDAGDISFPADNSMHGSAFNSVINCNQAFKKKEPVDGGIMVSFDPSGTGATTILLTISASSVSFANAQKNIDAEKETDFDKLKQVTQEKWRRHLSVIEIKDSNTVNKQKFYTALYHSLLIPWIISDADGRYRGADGQVHTAKGRYEYGFFSPWDTYRTLHPLLSLLFPGKQADILLSVMDIYYQTGHLPAESMTGNHAIPIITDAYLKGIHSMDRLEAYNAMKKSIVSGPFIQPDMQVFNSTGYIPFTWPESVTRTVEYAYDDWALAQFSKSVVHKEKDYYRLLNQSYRYRNLFNTDSLFLLPRNKNEFRLAPGNFGYKEGDKWVYSYAVPHNAKDLVNLMGGNTAFVNRLDDALCGRQIVFDNETVFHVPYLFNMADHPALTQKWVRKIMDTCFTATPGGLPGNDDLGSTSSWFVFSALGIYPLCPGNPFYCIGSPLFNEAVIHLSGKKIFTIKSTHAAIGNWYIHSLVVNNKPQRQLSISHASVMRGGSMIFDMTNTDNNHWFDKVQRPVFSETKKPADFRIFNYAINKKNIVPDELVWIKFSVKNNGATGTKIIKLSIDGKEYGTRNCLAGTHETINDSIGCRLYAEGKAKAFINGVLVGEFNIARPSYAYPQQPAIANLDVQPVVKNGDSFHVYFSAKNIGGTSRIFYVPVLLNDKVMAADTLRLFPGETRQVAATIRAEGEGLQKITVNDRSQLFKIYRFNKDALILDVRLIGHRSALDTITDISGFNHSGSVIQKNKTDVQGDSLLLGENCYVQFAGRNTIDHLDSCITMMAWVHPKEVSGGLVDVFSKGDNHVLQVVDGKQLSFFAGGWGRGDCTVSLPANWQNNWHHIAGVCDGKSLRVYIDGELKGLTKLAVAVNLSVNNKWTIGRNEEFPSQRIFTGYMDKVKVFAAPLSQVEIQEVMNQ